jgi:predicted metal-dependent HD superfamily phosphohydrolase
MSLKFDMVLAPAWFFAHKELGLWPDWKEYFRLRKAYSSPGRFYHTWQHIYECVKFVHIHYGWQALVVLALFYHDSVYDVDRKDNEEMSAKAWLDYAKRRRIACASSIVNVADMIRMTANHKVDNDLPYQFKMMNDADMHVFLCPDHHYLEYSRNIWREYSKFGRDQYLAGRRTFLASIDYRTIFYTHQARKKMKIARANLELERVILEDCPDEILVDV